MSLLDLMLDYTPEDKPEKKESDEVGPVSRPVDTDDKAFAAQILFVATNLDSWEADDVRFGNEVMLDVCYRQLDPIYYAYLRDRMTKAKGLFSAGKLDKATYEQLRGRFNAVHTWAIEHIGEERLLRAVRKFNPKRYIPPSEETFKAYRNRIYGDHDDLQEQPELITHGYPAESKLPHLYRVSSAAVDKVDAISESAMKLGWSRAALYQNRGRYPFPYGQDYGLVCFVSGSRRIGKISSLWIEILGPQPGTCNCFYNPQADQPWINRDDSGRAG